MARPYLLFEEFLTPVSYRALRRSAADNWRWFEHSQIISSEGVGSVDWRIRRSKILKNVETETSELVTNLMCVAPLLPAELGIPPFELDRVEVQLTATGDGGFFARHSDCGAPKNRSRALSFVYFAIAEPKEFEGGELSIDAFGHTYVIAPAANTLVVFRSDDFHEIRPVYALKTHFSSQRITANGWLHKVNPV